MFNLDYSTYGTGVLNATYIDTLMNGAGNNVIGLSFVNGNFITSVQGTGGCSYKQVDVTSGVAVVQPVTLAAGTFVSYDMATMVSGVGAAKKVNSISKVGPTTYQVTYDVKIKNYGNVNLNTVQVKDSVAKVFGGAFLTASIVAVGSLPSGVTLNPLFNGFTNSDFFAAGSTMKASPADSATIRVTVNLNSPILSNTYLNSAITTATGAIFGNNLRDSSMDQVLLDPDPIGKGVPDNAGEGAPTPLNLANWILLTNNIIDFNAKHTSTSNDLNWTLDNQEPGITTQVQRSSDGITFQTLTVIKSHSLTREQYRWYDVHPLPSHNYYRLQIVTPASNKKIYSEVVLISKPDASVSLTASPNPFTQSIKLTISLDRPHIINYRILDYVSTVMYNGQINGHEGQNEVDVHNLDGIPGGSYILEVIVGDKHYFKKIVKL
jgi:uncharacterized repeat protein (TIGR01451 family)